MYTKTYSEVARAAYLKAATAVYKVAASVLNDCNQPQEFRGATYEWARDLAAKHARAAQALKEQALEAAPVYDKRTVAAYDKAEGEYIEAVDRHLRLRDEWRKADPDARGKCRQCGAPMNPAERMLGQVCGKCCRANHRAFHERGEETVGDYWACKA